MKYKIIANPVADRGRAEIAIQKVQSILTDQGINYNIVKTEEPCHAVDLTKEAVSEDYDVIVAIGGDGTVNEVINGLMQSKKAGNAIPALGVVCAGSGNDFAYGIGIPSDLNGCCKILLQANKRSIDIGHVFVDNKNPGRFFGNGVGIGFDAVVGFEACKIKKLHGFLAYVIAALKTIFLYYKAPLVTIEYNEKLITQSSLLVSIMNGQRLGGGFKMAPDAVLDDGRFDLCIVGHMNRLRIFAFIFCFLRGTQAGKKPIILDRTRQITIQAENPCLPAHADGETLCIQGRRLEIELLPHQIEVIC